MTVCMPVGVHVCYYVLIVVREAVLQGFNATLFAYGQTGSGKTHTMMGDQSFLKDANGSKAPQVSADAGLVPRAAAWLFARAYRRRRLATCLVRVAFFEIYCEKVYDLLSPAREERKVRESPEKVVYVEGLVECVATHANEVLELLAKGMRVATCCVSECMETCLRQATACAPPRPPT